jgi:geranylgeranylglycerol-phosphate geranylgeranyltransferase
VLLGAWWARGVVTASTTWAALAAIALTATANAWNDIADIAIDARAHPERPLPSGRLSAPAARRIAAGAALAAIPLAALARPALGALTVPVLALMRAYSPHIKRSGPAGNITVAVLASLPFLYGAWSVGAPGAGVLLTAVGAPLHLAREIAKDLEDAEGDRERRRTIPHRWGEGAARRGVWLAVAAFAAAVATVASDRLPFALALLPAIFVSVAAARRAASGRRGAPALLKVAMLCAMAAFALDGALRG